MPDLAWIGASFTDAAKRTDEQARALDHSEQLIAELETTDLLVIEAPIWSFSIPASLKSWIDQVARARRTFRMLENGAEGLLKDRKTIVIVTTGGTPLGSGYDFATPYLRFILGFIGIKNVTFIDAGRLQFEADKPENARAEIAANLSAPLAEAGQRPPRVPEPTRPVRGTQCNPQTARVRSVHKKESRPCPVVSRRTSLPC